MFVGYHASKGDLQFTTTTFAQCVPLITIGISLYNHTKHKAVNDILQHSACWSGKPPSRRVKRLTSTGENFAASSSHKNRLILKINSKQQMSNNVL